MIKYIVTALLIILTIQQNLFLSPLYPPTAFEGQYFQVRFRVRGLDFPQFSFKGLPNCFSATSEGVVNGIPRGPGSYPVVISYGSGRNREQKQVVLRISPGFVSDSSFNSVITSQPVKQTQTITINYPTNLVFTVGANIQFKLEAKNGNSPLLWKYTNLPFGIYGDQSGLIRGAFVQSGYYSFSVSCSDAVGQTAEVFLTWNIQPKNYVRSTQLIDVQSRHVPLIYDINQVQKEQVEADNQLFKALDSVNKQKSIVTAKKKITALANAKLNNAQISYNIADKQYVLALSQRDIAQQKFRNTQNQLKSTQQNLNLAQIQQGNAQKNFINQRQDVSEAQKRFVQTQTDLTSAQDKLVIAQDNKRKADQNIRSTQTERDAAQNEYKRAFGDLQQAKGDLEVAKRRKQLTDLTVAQSKDSLLIVQQARDSAIAALNTADFTLKNSQANLNKILDKLTNIRSLYVNAKSQYGQAQWNFETALNKLYAAQARKQTADRASAIALAQGSLSYHNTVYNASNIGSLPDTISSSFVGCQAQVYPPISGTVKVIQKIQNGYVVSTGHQIIYGSCTQHSVCQVGDTLSYKGFIVNGVVNAHIIERVLFS